MLGHVVTKENLLTPWCPIEKKPIALAVRLHPSLHVVSFSAGKGLTHCPISGVPITEFEIVHQDTRLVTCTRDKKVFLDEKSCAFHEYVRYELSDAREQRARMRKRTHERLSEANAIDNVLAAKKEAAATEEQVAPDEALDDVEEDLYGDLDNAVTAPVVQTKEDTSLAAVFDDD